MTRQEILLKVRSIIADQLGNSVESVPEDAALDTLGLDSLDFVELLMSFEEAFNIEINDEDAVKYKTVANIVDAIDARLNKRA